MRFTAFLFLALVTPATAEPVVELQACRIAEELVPPLLERAFDPDPSKLDELVDRFATWPDKRIAVLATTGIPANPKGSGVEKMDWVKLDKSGYHVGHSYKLASMFGGFRKFILKQEPTDKGRSNLEAHLSAPLSKHWALSALSRREGHSIAVFERLRDGEDDPNQDSTWLVGSIVPTRTKVAKGLTWELPAGDKTIAHFLLRVRAPGKAEVHFKLEDNLQFRSAMNSDAGHGGYVQGELEAAGNGPPKLKVSMERTTFEAVRRGTEVRGTFGGAIPPVANRLGDPVTVPIKGRASTYRNRGGKWHGVSEQEDSGVVGRVVRFQSGAK